MMTILLSDTGKRYNHEWIFRHFNYRFTTGKTYAIIGANGAGKSTLLQCIGGAMAINEGTISYQANTHQTIEAGNIHQHLSIAAPYIELVEELTLTEFLQFHQSFKPFLASLSITDIISIIGLATAQHKQIRYYSSGMKQRVKLAQAIFSNTPLILLDEPCTNLDNTGIHLYLQLVNTYCKNRLTIISSNDKTEHEFCEEKINMTMNAH